jgi:hypothetical protein
MWLWISRLWSFLTSCIPKDINIKIPINCVCCSDNTENIVYE